MVLFSGTPAACKAATLSVPHIKHLKAYLKLCENKNNNNEYEMMVKEDKFKLYQVIQCLEFN